MNLTEKITSAELKFKYILEDYFIKTWGKAGLLSHNIDHHRRVWHYAKELLTESANTDQIKIDFSIDEFIMACFMHDLGMCIDPGERHGNYSHQLCRRFIEDSGLAENDFHNALEAIQHHDRKGIISRTDETSLYTFLAIADDLDAFGNIGIYRYVEIYLLRGIPKKDIGIKIMRNAHVRFANFEAVFGSIKSLHNKHALRFKILADFFSEFNVQINDNDPGSLSIASPVNIVDYISGIITDKGKQGELSENSLSLTGNKAINEFFLKYFMEIKTF